MASPSLITCDDCDTTYVGTSPADPCSICPLQKAYNDTANAARQFFPYRVLEQAQPRAFEWHLNDAILGGWTVDRFAFAYEPEPGNPHPRPVYAALLLKPDADHEANFDAVTARNEAERRYFAEVERVEAEVQRFESQQGQGEV